MNRLLLVSLFLIPVAASAQSRYVAKFVCGKPTSLENATLAVAPGTYFTAINVHNITGNVAASLRKRFSSGKVGEQPGAVSSFVSVTVQPGQTILVDCRDILGHIGGPAFAEGAVEIFSNVDLDVIGVYTTVGASNLVTTMTIDRAPKR